MYFYDLKYQKYSILSNNIVKRMDIALQFINPIHVILKPKFGKLRSIFADISLC